MKIIAHRGSSAQAPENTLAAFRLAIDEGADGVEFDLRLARDGTPVVIHDATLERTGGDPRGVGELNVRELKQLDVGKWKGAPFAGEQIPTLEETLKLLPPEKLLLIELKEGPETVAPVLERVAVSAHADARHIYMSFNWETCRELRRQAGDWPILGLVPPPSSVKEPLTQLAAKARAIGLAGLGISDLWLEKLQSNSILHRNVFLDEEAPLTLSAWTIDHAGRARAWRALGATLLTTNEPLTISKALAGGATAAGA